KAEHRAALIQWIEDGPSRLWMAWSAGGSWTLLSDCSRNSRSRSAGLLLAGPFGPWATASFPPGPAEGEAMHRTPIAARLSTVARTSIALRPRRSSLVTTSPRRGPDRAEEQDHPALGQAWHPARRLAGSVHRSAYL